MAEPTVDELAAYCAGTISIERFEVVDAWLATLPAAEQERLLGQLTVPADLASPEPLGGIFTPEHPDQRYTHRGELGAGGMGIVDLVHDRVLDREVALKRCRPRGIDEPVAAHAVRLRLFRREAAITARLAHPGIVPVHDVGIAAAGEPAYVMSRLSGTTLAQRAPLPPAEAADVLIRVADAVGFAHHQGIVHRDLKPEHVWLGTAGETLVIDWGLAGAVGAALSQANTESTDLGGVIGTPPWCAPETRAATPADPRMDVWALGALLRFALTALPPDHGRALPARGLGAIIEHCQHTDPARRYADGAEVAADVRRWLRDGLALAEDPSWPVRAVIAGRTTIRRHPLLSAASLAIMLGLAAITAVILRERAAASQQALAQLGAPTPDAAGLRQWRDELNRLPETAAVRQAQNRIVRALAADELLTLSQRYAHQGPWPTEVADLTAALQAAGCDPTDPHAAERLTNHPDRALLLPVAVQLQRALLVGRIASPLTTAIPRLIAGAAPNAAWTSIADLLTRPIIGPHDLELCACAESEAALHQGDTVDVLLATYAPDARLEHLALQRIAAAPGAFWPRVTAGRAALAAGRIADTRRHALVALGAESASLWPHLLLAYAALADDGADGGNDELQRESTAGLAVNSAHLELQALLAVALARSGKLAEAQAMIDRLHEAPHFLHHLEHRVGHPMERTADALRAAGVIFNRN